MFKNFVYPPVNPLQVKGSHKKDYKKVRDTGVLEPYLLREFSTLRNSEGNAKSIETLNLIFVFSKSNFFSASTNWAEIIVAATRQLSIPYVLFNRESETYRFFDQHHIRASSEDTVGLIHEIVRTHVRTRVKSETEHDIDVYEVR